MQFTKKDFKYIIKILFSLSIIFWIIKFKTPFIMGFLYGMVLMGFLFLFPSPQMLLFFDKLFNYSKTNTVIMKNESESKQYNENKVKFRSD